MRWSTLIRELDPNNRYTFGYELEPIDLSEIGVIAPVERQPRFPGRVSLGATTVTSSLRAAGDQRRGTDEVGRDEGDRQVGEVLHEPDRALRELEGQQHAPRCARPACA